MRNYILGQRNSKYSIHHFSDKNERRIKADINPRNAYNETLIFDEIEKELEQFLITNAYIMQFLSPDVILS